MNNSIKLNTYSGYVYLTYPEDLTNTLLSTADKIITNDGVCSDIKKPCTDCPLHYITAGGCESLSRDISDQDKPDEDIVVACTKFIEHCGKIQNENTK